MKAEKMQDNIDEHLSGVAEYAEYWNELAIGTITNAVQQVGEMPARIARRDRLSAARSRDARPRRYVRTMHRRSKEVHTAKCGPHSLTNKPPL